MCHHVAGQILSRRHSVPGNVPPSAAGIRAPALVGAIGSSLALVAITRGVIISNVIRSFAEVATEDIFAGVPSRQARATCPELLWPVARRRMDQLNRVRYLDELRIPQGNRLERLRGIRDGQHSIRINERHRICFRWEDGYADEVEVTDYH